ncbi:hypothetical protein C8K38_11799 [Rhodococcus sp. OK611]|nr:hypothetical protein C8K38_11799 [Rhodococcus sp. OK611]SNX92985.1 hypothetical protein SAMN05447004_11799 [Rhodococcus sp. OK270]
MSSIAAPPFAVSSTAVSVKPVRNDPAAALDDSCLRLRGIYPEYPRVYAVALMADQGKRRWWSAVEGIHGDRLERMVERALADLCDPEAAAASVATALIHAVIGRVASLVVLEGRAWDPGLENLWLHMDSDGCIDWAGVSDPVLRVLPGDRWAGTRAAVTLPCEGALLVWTVHRCHTALVAFFDALDLIVPLDRSRLWAMVGEAILGAATLVPILGGVGESAAMRRGQGLLDAFEGAGVPVRARADRAAFRRGVAALAC